MLDLGAVTLNDLMDPAQEACYRLEVYDGFVWRDLSALQFDSDERFMDGGLEAWTSATDLTNWSEGLSGASTINREASVIHGGTYSARIDIDASNNGARFFQTATLTKGAKHRLSMWYRTAAGKTAAFKVEDTDSFTHFLLADGTWGASNNGIVLPSTSGSWVLYQIDFWAFGDHSSYSISFAGGYWGASSASSSIYFDDVNIKPAPINYLKSLGFTQAGAGASPEPIAATWQAEVSNEDGVFHPKHPTSSYKDLLRLGRKARLSVGINSYVNLLTDGGLEAWTSATDLAYWEEWVSGTSSVNRESSSPFSGQFCARLDVDGSGNYAEVVKTSIPTLPGRTYRCSAAVKMPTGKAASLKLYDESGLFVNSAGGWQVSEVGFWESWVDPTPNGEWVRKSVTFVAPTTNLLRFQFICSGSASWSGYVDDVRLELVPKTPTLWQRLIGYLDPPRFSNRDKTVSLSGCDYSKALTDTILRRPSNYMGSLSIQSSQDSNPTLGSELYTINDAIKVGTDNDDMSGWTIGPYGDEGGISWVTEGGGGSTYVAELAANPSTAVIVAYKQMSTPSLTLGKTYRVNFDYTQTAGSDDCTFELKILKSNSQTEVQGTSGAFHSYDWVNKTFYFVATQAGVCRVWFELFDVQYLTQACYIDNLSVKEVTAYTNTTYAMPSDCNGPYYATLDGTPHWFGEETQGWVYNELLKQFKFVDNYIVAGGTNNLYIYYYTDQSPEGVIAHLLYVSGLYASAAAALADMTYVPTGVLIPRVWFDSGMSAMEAVQKVCERVDYRFWFDETGKPVFRPAVSAGAILAEFTAKQMQDLSDYQDLSEIRNRVVIEGMELTMYSQKEPGAADDRIEPSKLKAEASDSTSIATYLEKTYSVQNHLFQTQASVNALAASILAAYKDPKLYAELSVPHNVIPLQRGDTIQWEIPLRAALDDGVKYGTTTYGTPKYGDGGLKALATGVIRDISFQGAECRIKCQIV